MAFEYNCPDCGTANHVHAVDCDYGQTPSWKVRKAYTDIISILLSQSAKQTVDDDPPGVSYSDLREAVEDMLANDTDSETVRLASVDGERDAQSSSGADTPASWTTLHNDCLTALKRFGRVEEREEMGGLRLLPPDEQSTGIVPSFDPIKTVFEYGPIDGCKDIAVYSMVSWCELKDLSWDATQAFIAWWLTETGRWESEHWGEDDIAELCEAKRHIYEESMGWGDHPDVAKSEMERSSKTRQLDVDEVADTIGRETFE